MTATTEREAPYMQWRDITDDLGLRTQTLEVSWRDARDIERLSFVEHDAGSLHAVFGPELDDVVALTLASDLRRYACGERARYLSDAKLEGAFARAAETCRDLARQLGHIPSNVCDGCSGIIEPSDLRAYRVVHHDHTESTARYCDDCADLARCDWNGETAAISVLETATDRALQHLRNQGLL